MADDMWKPRLDIDGTTLLYRGQRFTLQSTEPCYHSGCAGCAFERNNVCAHIPRGAPNCAFTCKVWRAVKENPKPPYPSESLVASMRVVAALVRVHFRRPKDEQVRGDIRTLAEANEWHFKACHSAMWRELAESPGMSKGDTAVLSHPIFSGVHIVSHCFACAFSRLRGRTDSTLDNNCGDCPCSWSSTYGYNQCAVYPGEFAQWYHACSPDKMRHMALKIANAWREVPK